MRNGTRVAKPRCIGKLTPLTLRLVGFIVFICSRAWVALELFHYMIGNLYICSCALIINAKVWRNARVLEYITPSSNRTFGLPFVTQLLDKFK